MRNKSDAQVEFSVQQIEWLRRTFAPQAIQPDWDMQRIMFQAGQQSIVDIIAARQYKPRTSQVNPDR